MPSTLNPPHLPKRWGALYDNAGTGRSDRADLARDVKPGRRLHLDTARSLSSWCLLSRPCHRSRHHRSTMTAMFGFSITGPRNGPRLESPQASVKKHYTKVTSRKPSVPSIMGARFDDRDRKITMCNYGAMLSYSITPRIHFANTDPGKFMADCCQKPAYPASPVDLHRHSRILRIAPALVPLAYPGLTQRLLSSLRTGLS